MSQVAFAAIGGSGKHSQINYEAGRRAPDTTYLTAIAQAGVDLAYILTGIRGSPGLPAYIAQDPHGAIGRLIAAEMLGSPETFNPEDYVPIPRIEAEIAAGTGSINSTEVVTETFAFRLDWLRSIGVAPANGCLVKVRGDSMEPLLRDHDIVLVDRARTQVRPGQVYALRDGGEARVKRLDRPDPETLVLRSDNPAHPLEFRRGAELEAVTILGQVVWSGHTW